MSDISRSVFMVPMDNIHTTNSDGEDTANISSEIELDAEEDTVEMAAIKGIQGEWTREIVP